MLAKRVAAAEAAKPATEAAAAPVASEAPRVEPPKQDDSALREARMLQQMQQRDRDVYETKQRADELTKQLKQRDEVEARRKANPIDALKDYGYSYEDLTKGIIEGKFAPQSPEQLAIDANKSEVQQLREQLEAMQSERQQETQRTRLESHTQLIAGQLKEAGGEFPVIASMPWAAAHLAQYQMQNPQADLTAYARELEGRAANDVKSSLTSDHALKAFLADEGIKTRVMALLGITKPSDTPAQQAATGIRTGNGPSAIPSSAASDPGTRKTPSRAVTDQERKANALRAVMAKRQTA